MKKDLIVIIKIDKSFEETRYNGDLYSSVKITGMDIEFVYNGFKCSSFLECNKTLLEDEIKDFIVKAFAS
ncbi:hypothetical protein OD350_06235 [Clostridium beijerinckii]|uniref:hypothetical protein n=1 Tax=Clostridium beijerinckii TaxID=1520 RepID=UPI002226B9A5|nr:hypothetical protein [Clostridium beijerinckii]UYZ37259.1 hypothetical protein OD350_06235 [Clostridium beijerinckii]